MGWHGIPPRTAGARRTDLRPARRKALIRHEPGLRYEERRYERALTTRPRGQKTDAMNDAMNSVQLPGLPFPLDPVGSPPIEHALDGEALVLTGAAGTDLFGDPA